MIKILSASGSLNPLEELFIQATIGSTIRSFEGEISHATILLNDSLPGGDSIDCAIEVETVAGRIHAEANGLSSNQAFMGAAEQLDRRLFSALHRGPGSDAPEESLAA